MTVTTTWFFFNAPLSFISIAHIAIIWSPSTLCPFSSQTITLSASPSSAIPISAFSFFTTSIIFSGCIAPQSKFMFNPSGLSLSTITSAPSSLNICDAVLYAAPFAQSSTIINPLRLMLLTEAFTNSIYLPFASSILYAFPTKSPLTCSVFTSSDKTYFSISSSTISGSLYPSSLKIFIPLSSAGLCEALSTIPASAFNDLVRCAIAGVGIGPTSKTSAPTEAIPEANAFSSI